MKQQQYNQWLGDHFSWLEKIMKTFARTMINPTSQHIVVLTCEFVEMPSRLSAREMSESTSWYVFGGGKYDGTLGNCIIPSILLPWWFTVTQTNTL